jgi:hypothetical protein
MVDRETCTKGVWLRLEGHGSGSVTDQELKNALKQVRAAIPYLEARPNRYPLALSDARLTEMKLMDYARVRGLKVDG